MSRSTSERLSCSPVVLLKDAKFPNAEKLTQYYVLSALSETDFNNVDPALRAKILVPYLNAYMAGSFSEFNIQIHQIERLTGTKFAPEDRAAMLKIACIELGFEDGPPPPLPATVTLPKKLISRMINWKFMHVFHQPSNTPVAVSFPDPVTGGFATDADGHEATGAAIDIDNNEEIIPSTLTILPVQSTPPAPVGLRADIKSNEIGANVIFSVIFYQHPWESNEAQWDLRVKAIKRAS